MKIAFPTDKDKGMESPVYGHFGSASAFIIVDSDSGAYQTVNNGDKDHIHGQCQPLAALGGTDVNAVVVGGIGAGALMRLNSSNIKVYRGVEGTVAENLRMIKADALPMLTMDQTCAGHGHQQGCAH